MLDAGIAGALAIAIAIAIAARDESGANEPDPLAYGLGLAIAAALLVRRRWPRGVLLASAALLVVYHVLDYPAIGLAVPLAPALYTAAAAGYVSTAVLVIAGLELWALIWRTVGEDQSLVTAVGTQTLFEVTLMAAMVLLADTLRSRRAWASEMRERLRRTEADREREAERRVGQERLRIARELHDVLAHTITVIGVQARVAAEALEDSPGEARAALGTIRDTTREAMAELRATVGVLRDSRERAPRAPAPGLSQLDELVDAAAGSPVRVEVSIAGVARTLPPVVDVTAYRILQESLTNVLRHADATLARVTLRYEPEALVVQVEDDGESEAANASAGEQDGHGLAGMRERAAAVGGHLEAGRLPGRRVGFRIRAWLPTERAGR
jgi:signal transduction histidine kinase